MPDPQVHLTVADAIEPAEMLTLIGQWLGGADRDQLAASFARFIGANGYDPAGLRTDLARFSFLLGSDDGEQLFGTTDPPADQDHRGSPRNSAAGTVLGMLVTDLHHFLDLPQDTPGPARRLAEHLSNIVKAATAGDAGTPWESALPCRRRPANRRCPGRMIVLRTEPQAPIRWQCSACNDEGVISNWEDSPFDLRRRRLTLAGAVHQIVIPNEVAAALRELRLLDTDRERLVFGIRADNDHAILAATGDGLDELIGSVAAEANHEPNRRRQQRLDAAFDALNTATQTPDG